MTDLGIDFTSIFVGFACNFARLLTTERIVEFQPCAETPKLCVNRSSCIEHSRGQDQIRLAAMADSTREYLLKQYLLAGKMHKQSLEMRIMLEIRSNASDAEVERKNSTGIWNNNTRSVSVGTASTMGVKWVLVAGEKQFDKTSFCDLQEERRGRDASIVNRA
ncbi:hypothetical protein DFH06DRAFT_1140557 [Mycena polygramma]|nr:hypothetical protein DFH06DRAFT_1140557 [Mycena polygramma]